MAIKKGNKVVLEYEGKLDSGEVFDSTERAGKPLEFAAGEGKVIKGFDDAVIGMEKGQEKEFKIKPEEAYGEVREDLMREVPRNAVQLDKEPKAGMTLVMATPEGQQIPLKIVEVKPDALVLDMNHPLAGQNLNFKIKIVDVKD
jgi:FKBP-type peptidyl-prolyl cis-trans isomerase 2